MKRGGTKARSGAPNGKVRTDRYAGTPRFKRRSSRRSGSSGMATASPLHSVATFRSRWSSRGAFRVDNQSGLNACARPSCHVLSRPTPTSRESHKSRSPDRDADRRCSRSVTMAIRLPPVSRGPRSADWLVVTPTATWSSRPRRREPTDEPLVPDGARAARQSGVADAALGLRGSSAPEWRFGRHCGRRSFDSER